LPAIKLIEDAFGGGVFQFNRTEGLPLKVANDEIGGVVTEDFKS